MTNPGLYSRRHSSNLLKTNSVSDEDAARAVKERAGAEFMGRRIYVELALPPGMQAAKDKNAQQSPGAAGGATAAVPVKEKVVMRSEPVVVAAAAAAPVVVATPAASSTPAPAVAAVFVAAPSSKPTKPATAAAPVEKKGDAVGAAVALLKASDKKFKDKAKEMRKRKAQAHRTVLVFGLPAPPPPSDEKVALSQKYQDEVRSHVKRTMVKFGR